MSEAIDPVSAVPCLYNQSPSARFVRKHKESNFRRAASGLFTLASLLEYVTVKKSTVETGSHE